MAIAGPTDLSHTQIVDIDELMMKATICQMQDVPAFGRVMLRDGRLGVGLFAHFHHEQVQDDDPEWLIAHAVCWAPARVPEVLERFHPDGRPIMRRGRVNPIASAVIAAVMLLLIAAAATIIKHYTGFPN